MEPLFRNIIHTARQKLKQLGGQALNLILPRSCAGCGKANEAFCKSCAAVSYKNGAQCLACGFRNNDGKFCQKCMAWKLSFQVETKFPLKRVLWAGRYDGALKEAIWQFKYQKRKELAKPLAEMLWKKFCEVNESPSRQPTFQDTNIRLLADFAVIPIPLHFKKEHERGFNQAELLAKEFSKLSNIQCLTSALTKTRETQAQVAVENKELRIKNLEGAFEVIGNNPPNPPYFSTGGGSAFGGKGGTIILIDDVSTTGATLIHASEALAKAGVGDIVGLVVAHGG